MAVLVMAITPSCSKDNDPEPTPDPENPTPTPDPNPEIVIDPELVGTWESKLIYQTKDLDVKLTFNEDATLNLDVEANLVEGQEPYSLTASGLYKAEDGVISFQITESSNESLVGVAYQIKYEIVVGQLYLQNLSLFPFDKVE